MTTQTQVPVLPTSDELAAVRNRLAQLEEEIADTVQPVFEAIHYYPEDDGERVTITWEHIGSLAVFAHDVDEVADRIARLAANLHDATMLELDGVMNGSLDGHPVYEPRFTEYGHRIDPGEHWKREREFLDDRREAS